MQGSITDRPNTLHLRKSLSPKLELVTFPSALERLNLTIVRILALLNTTNPLQPNVHVLREAKPLQVTTLIT